MNKFPIFGLLLNCVSVIFTLISLIPNYWVHYEKVNGNLLSKVWIGLWQYCSSSSYVSTTGTETCYYHYEDNFPADKAFLGVTQTLICLGLIVQVVSLVFSFLKMSLIQDKRNIYQIIIALSAIAGIILIIGAIIFAARVNDLDPTGAITYTEDLHFAFAFAIVSGIASIGGAIFSYIETTKDSIY